MQYYSCNRLALLLLMLQSSASAGIVIKRVSYVTDAFDQILQDALDAFDPVIDPFKIDGTEVKVGKPVPLVRFKLQDIEVDGLADMNRVGDVILYKSGNVKTLKVYLEAPRLFYLAKTDIMLAKITLHRTLFGHADTVQAYLEIDYDTVTEKVSLKQFRITKLTKLRLQYDGSPIGVEQLSNFLLNLVGSSCSRIIKFGIEQTFTQTLAQIFSSSPFFKQIMRSL